MQDAVTQVLEEIDALASALDFETRPQLMSHALEHDYSAGF